MNRFCRTRKILFQYICIIAVKCVLLCKILRQLPITVAARSKVRHFFARLNAGIVGSNPTQGMNVCLRLFCVCVVLCR
jgi:hypothetical protein